MEAWRELFDEIDASWIDRGKNCSRGHINIACPWCDDPSHHLSLNESSEKYYCFRCTHGGTSLTHLLVGLGVAYLDVPDLLNRHNLDVVITTTRPVKQQSAIAKAWHRFEPAADNPACTDYLRDRGFPSPVATCRLYDLRRAPAGKWAQRLLVPVMENDEIVCWVGRSIRNNIEPKYYFEPCDHPVIYVPRKPRDTMVVVEGPLDALKIAVATEALPISSVALLGKGHAADKITRITELCKDCSYIVVALDADVCIVDTHEIVHELRSSVRCPVSALDVPEGCGDPGAMTLEAIRNWLASVHHMRSM